VRIRGPEFLINTLRVLFEYFPIPFEGNSTFETLDASGGAPAQAHSAHATTQPRRTHQRQWHPSRDSEFTRVQPPLKY